uniref:Uncharacterized protein n=1 Tax=Rhizophora mucronata TaxID=61149 RepID=A0A2P2PLK8_RHIMU
MVKHAHLVCSTYECKYFCTAQLMNVRTFVLLPSLRKKIQFFHRIHLHWIFHY